MPYSRRARHLATVAPADGAFGGALYPSSLPLGVPPHAAAVDQPAHTAFIASAGDGRITMLDMRTGALLRTVRVGRYPTAIVVARPQGRVFVAASDGDTTDFILRSATIPGMPMRQGTISVLDARSGALLRTSPLRLQPFQLAVDERAGRVLVMNYSGKSVILLDARDGTVLAERRLGVRPIRVQVDARAGRAIVAGGCCAIAPAKGLAIVDTHTGRVLRGHMTGLGSAMALDTRRGRTYLSNSPGLEVLDTRSGQLLPNMEDDLALDTGQITFTSPLARATSSSRWSGSASPPATQPRSCASARTHPPRPSQPCSPWTRRVSGSTSPSGCGSWYSTPQPAGRSRRSRCPSRSVSWLWILPPGTCSWPARIHRAAAGRAVSPPGWHPSPAPRSGTPARAPRRPLLCQAGGSHSR